MCAKQQFLDLGELPPVAPMLAVTVRQPWAWFIVRPDVLTDEARAEARARGKLAPGMCLSFRPDDRLKPGGRIWIHAGDEMTPEDFRAASDLLVDRGIFEPYELPTLMVIDYGGIVGWATFGGIETQSQSPWFTGGKFWRLENSQPCELKKMASKPGLFDIGRELERRAEHRRAEEYRRSKRREQT